MQDELTYKKTTCRLPISFICLTHESICFTSNVFIPKDGGMSAGVLVDKSHPTDVDHPPVDSMDDDNLVMPDLKPAHLGSCDKPVLGR